LYYDNAPSIVVLIAVVGLISMSTLAETFLADLGSDGESGSDDEQQHNEASDTEAAASTTANGGDSDDEHQSMALAPEEEDYANAISSSTTATATTTGMHDSDDVAVVSMLKYTDVSQVTKLLNSPSLQLHLAEIQRYMNMNRTRQDIKGTFEEDDEYRLIVESNRIVMEIGDEINAIHKFIRDHYAPKFPELEQLVPNPMDYARIVQRIGNETDLTRVELTDLLPAANLMVLQLTASSTSGRALSDDEIAIVLKACDAAIKHEESRNQILEYVESRMSFVAPNLSAIVGSAIAARLVGIAGGLNALSRMPASNIQVLGIKRKTLAGFSTATMVRHVGFLNDCDIVKKSPPSLKTKACRLVATKCTLAARADCYGESIEADIGQKLRQEIEKRIEKLQEPQLAKQIKALPAPDDAPRKKRGGRRMRKQRERYAVTELRKHENRMAFGEPEEELGLEGKGLGMIGHSNKVRITVSDRKVSKKLAADRAKSGTSTNARSGGSGLATSLAFTPVQGFELEDPSAARKRVEEANKRYFSSTGTFTQVGAAKDKPSNPTDRIIL
jgi:U4/U6 small nuclear ribonucleoprotein PRP31